MNALYFCIFLIYFLLLLKFRVKSRIDGNQIAKDLASVSKSIRKLMPVKVVYVRELTLEEPKVETEQARDSLGRFASSEQKEEASPEEQWTRVYYVNEKGETCKRSEIHTPNY